MFIRNRQVANVQETSLETNITWKYFGIAKYKKIIHTIASLAVFAHAQLNC